MLKNSTYLAENIKKIYSSIKNNDLEMFKYIISLDKSFLTLKNKKEDNLLFYCLDKKNIEIFNLILKKKPSLLLEKNIEGFNCFTNLINKGSLKNIDFFLERITEKNKEILFSSLDNENNNLLMQVLKKGNLFYQSYQKSFENYNDIKIYSQESIEGQTIPHLIALHDVDSALSVLNIPQFKKLGKKNNNGVTPFLLASRYSSFELFKKIAEKSNIHEKSDLLSNAFHFSAYEGDVKKLNYLLEKGLNPNEKNLYNNTALSTALVEKKFDFSLELLKVVNEVEFEDVLFIVRASEKNSLLCSYLLENKTLILNTIKKRENLNKFLTYIFYYSSEGIINKNEDFIKGLIGNDSKLLNSLFLSSIAGRRDFLFKVNYLIKNYGWLNLEIENFTNFSKEYPSGFVYALNQLPKNQLEYLVNNAPILENLDKKEQIIFKTICINKNTDIFQKIKKLDDFSLLGSDISILPIINKISPDKIINNLIFFENLFVNKEVTDFVSNKIASHIYNDEAPMKTFKNIFVAIKNVNFKKEIYIKLNKLFLSDSKSNELESLFENKYTIMENVLNDLLIKTPNDFQNFKYLTSNQTIKLKPESAWSYLKVNNFDKKSFLIISKAPDLLNYIKNIDLSKESNISVDFFKLVMQMSDKHQKVNFFINFLKYSSFYDNISPNSYNYFFTHFTEKEQKNITEIAFNNFFKLNGTSINTYQFLERKYLNYHTKESLNTLMCNNGKLEHIIYRVKTDNSYINIFNSNFFNNINIINFNSFQQSIDNIKEKIDNFSEYALRDFLLSSIKDEHLMGLSKMVMENKSQDLSSYLLLVKKLESFLSEKPVLGEYFQQVVEKLLFNENIEIQNLIFKNEIIINSSYLSDKQNKYIFTKILEDNLKNKKEVKKLIKI